MSASAVLAGIRVLDVTRVMSGPFCTAMLADLGAEVIKVEQPEVGDMGRTFAPHVDGESAYFMMLNRGKQSMTVDLKHPEGRSLILRLAERCDVFVENFRPGTASRLGLDYDAVRSVRPDIVYCSIYGFGSETDQADLPAFDLVIQAMSGIMDVTGPRDGEPTAVGESIADVATGMYAAFGIASALHNRNETGLGSHLEVAMLDATFSMLLTPLSRQLYTSTRPRRVGNRHPETYPVDAFPTRDGTIVLVVPNNDLMSALGQVLGQPGLAKDERFLDNPARNQHEHELRELITSWTTSRSTDGVLTALRRVGIPCGPVQTLGEVIDSDYARHRGLVTMGRHRELGEIPLVRQPIRFGEPDDRVLGVPALGENTASVLRDLLQLDDADVQRLRAEHVIGSEDQT